jgi:DNA polymerase-3 subunit epsilon
LLSDVSYTVFDTETTGLDPAGGDEIVQIGAARIVNGKLLRGERFDQLIDPHRSIPEASIRIHGIRPEQVRGKPSITDVLPAFHAFIGDTVLVGHNVAFDLRFLKRKEASSGLPFDQPVLDTLILSSVVHPNEPSHGLETIAARLGVTISGRHTAFGDALVTGELFLKLLPLLAQRGILTLSQAREAARTSYYAKLRY